MSTINNCNNKQLDSEEIIITPKEYNNILNIQQEILNMVAEQHKTKDILGMLCKLAETLLPNSVASIMMKEENTGLMGVISAPSVPQVGHDALQNLKPGPGGGSCGNAVFRNEAQFVQNTFEDKRWTDIRDIAVNFNICSCWSMPVRDSQRTAIGSFALSSFEHRSPSAFHQKLLESAAAIVTIVLKNQSREERLKLFSQAMQNASDGMIITDEKNKIIEVNQAFEDIYGYTLKDLDGVDPSFLASKKHKKEFYSSMWDVINENDKWSGEIINKKKNGDLITQWMSISTLYDEEKNIKNYLAVFTDLSELKKAQEKSEYLAYRDSLTGLYNKSYLEKIINDNLEKTLILLNINNFSYINTAYGFDIGDELLKQLAFILEDDFDIEKTFRFNADEFALLFKNNINIKSKIEELQKYFFENSICIDNIKLNLTFSIGAVSSKNNLLRNCATALKKAKELGKNRYYIFKDEDSQDYTNKDKFITASNLVRDAIENNKIVPFFQGIYCNKTKQINKYESLVRIEKDGEFISPFYFLEAAKLSGLLPDITKKMIEKSFEKMAVNKSDFSINITEEDLSQNYLVDFLTQKLSDFNINVNRITLEILEGISSSGKKNHIKQLSALKKLGFKIAIDDFGREYSNFERLIDLDIDYIKIDAKYIKDINTNKKSYEITKALAYFAKNSNIKTIAEFVHNEEVQNIIKELEIDYSQGYFFSEPKKEIN